MEDPKKTSMDNSSALMDEVLKLLVTTDSPSLASLIESRRNELGLSTKGASEVLGIPRSSYDRLITGALQKPDVLTALKLAHFLDVSVEEVIKMFAASVMPTDDFKSVERVKEASFIIKNFDVARLRKIGFIESIDYGHISARIIQYFGLNSLYEYGTESAAVLFSRAKTNVEDKMMSFWIMSAYKQFKRIDNPNPFDSDRVEKLSTQIQQFTRKEKTGLLTVMRALYNAGVTVITQKSLPNTSVQGGTFIVNKKPCIVITDHFKSYPLLWLTLLHELGHVIFHLDKLAVLKYHITDGIEDLMLMEPQADRFARQMLLPTRKFEYIKNYINIESFVASYAEQNGIHSSIIYYMHAKELSDQNDKTGFQYYNRFLTKSDVCSDQLHKAPWINNSLLVEEADKVKELLATNSQSSN
ncbi:XRE family transcriptional regulator [Hymenobacter sp.]|uniref:XRE family transcriptional regulator n=1 Tax=Hymenobacter sp. TaxID=1898978 RepID=UPI00286C9792|nr:XRE family transcriptional regulator [Hymenobacter sp.]